MLRRTPAQHTVIEAAGARAWIGGTLWWLLDRPFAVVVAWWARFVPLSATAKQSFLAVLGLQAAAIATFAVTTIRHLRA